MPISLHARRGSSLHEKEGSAAGGVVYRAMPSFAVIVRRENWNADMQKWFWLKLWECRTGQLRRES